MITYSFDLKYDSARVAKKIQLELVPQIEKLFKSKTVQVEKIVRTTLEKHVRSQKEWYSIARGQLRMHFGLPNSLRNIQNILSQWLASISVDFKKLHATIDGKYTGGLSIKAVRSSYSDVFKVSDAVFVTEKGDSLPWLKWLLTSGTNIEITDYMIGRGRGRAGNLIMVPGRSGWGVPPQFAGTKDDNMITRAIMSAEEDMIREIERVLSI